MLQNLHKFILFLLTAINDQFIKYSTKIPKIVHKTKLVDKKDAKHFLTEINI